MLRVLPFVDDLLGEAGEVFYVQHRAIVEHGAAVKDAEHLMKVDHSTHRSLTYAQREIAQNSFTGKV